MNSEIINEKISTTVNSQSKISVEERVRFLKNLKSEIKLNEEDIYEALDLDLKKPRFETFATEIGFLLNEIELLPKIGDICLNGLLLIKSLPSL